MPTHEEGVGLKPVTYLTMRGSLSAERQRRISSLVKEWRRSGFDELYQGLGVLLVLLKRKEGKRRELSPAVAEREKIGDVGDTAYR
jgi:hypothetical protein